MEVREESDKMYGIAERLIKTQPELAYINNSSVRIVCLESDQKKRSGGLIIHGECEKVPSKYKWSIKADFTITFFKPNNDYMSDKQLEALMFHELLHIGIEKKDDGTEKYSIVPHDLEDFRIIVDKFGTNWSTELF